MKPLIGLVSLTILVLNSALSTALKDINYDIQETGLYKRTSDPSYHRLYKRSPEVVDTPSAGKGRKSDPGTKDAPVDGADGKPHAGPFVDPIDAETPSKSTKEATGSKQKPVPEDGVMNDPHREAPKKGTTGTEGGVTEKMKSKEAHENETGRKKIQKPESPKDADSVSHKEDDTGTVNSGDKHKNSKGSDRTAQKASKEDEQPGKTKGTVSKEKLEDDSEKSHYTFSGTSKNDDKPGQKSDASHTRLDDAGNTSNESGEEDEVEGAHDLIRWDSLFGSFTSIVATEIGDKTFIVAALMAMRHSRLQVFSAAFTALFIMTILSGVTGHAVGAIISKKWSALLAAALFLVFGAKSLKEGADMDSEQGASEEIREVQAELEEKEIDMARANGHKRISSLSPDVLESGRIDRSRSRSRMAPAKRSPSSTPPPSASRPSVASAVGGIKNLLSLILSPAWVETFSMTFIGELGDRSQIATVAMAAGQEYFWIMVGATIGHFVCTGGAVLGGSALAGRISMRTVTLSGGFIFIGFGLFTLFEAIQYFR